MKTRHSKKPRKRIPYVFIIAGPNGAGKTTLAPFLLRDALHLTEYVNADPIAQGLSGFRPESVGFEAGRIMLRRIHALAERGSNFAFETTLATRSYAHWIKKIKDDGYVVSFPEVIRCGHTESKNESEGVVTT
ncbi:zeta toxin family protein [bacterium]|nr:zeta toxin family protein [bacterium]